MMRLRSQRSALQYGPHSGRQRGTTLVLVPTFTLVFLVLAGIAVDLSSLHLAHRRAHTVVAVAADDAAGMLDERALQLEGAITIDEAAAARVARAHILAAELPGRVLEEPSVTFATDGRGVTVALTLQVEHIFLKPLPGLDHEVVTVTASARLNG